MTAYTSLADYYRVIAKMKFSAVANWTVEEVENLVPFERRIYLSLQKEQVEALKRK